ncbi:hypothetical protein PGB90_002998 [Kerria lacca]
MISEWTRILITNGLLIIALYTSSIGLVFFQQWYLQLYPYPFFSTSFNQIVRFVLSWLYRVLYFYYTGKRRISLSWSDNLRKMVAFGCISGIHMSLSNWSLDLNTVSVFTVSKSTSIVFVLLFGILLHLEKNSLRIILIVFMISTGLALFTYKSAQFNVVGFVIAMSSAFMSGLRWTLTQYVLQESDLGLENPFDLMYYLDIWACLTIMPIMVVTEGSSVLNELNTLTGACHLLSLACISGLLASCLEITKYIVIRRMSSLTDSILGIAKDIVTLVLAYLFQDDQMSFINFVGLVFCLSGVVSHAVYKYRRAKKRHYIEITNEKDLEESFSSSDDSGLHKNPSYLDLCHP